MAKKLPTGKKDRQGRAIFEGDTVMTGSPVQFISIEWQEVKCEDDILGPGTMCGFFIPDDCRLLVDNKHPGFDTPSNS